MPTVQLQEKPHREMKLPINTERFNYFSLLPCAALGLLFDSCPFLAAEGPTFGDPVSTGTVNVPGLDEASGMIASRSNDGVFWSHNDKGGLPRIYAFAITGEHLGTYNLPGATAIDYEDMTVGPGPISGVDYLYVGDTGDGNKAPVRESIQIYRAPEPAVYLSQAASSVETDLSGLTTLSLKYPDGPRNAESLMMDPLTGDLYIIPLTKLPAASGIYRATKEQLIQGGTIMLSREGEVTFAVASGGDISPTGKEIVLRQERLASVWVREPGQTVAGALAGIPCSLPIVGKPDEQNGEAIAFDPEGWGYYTLSDSLATQPLRYFGRTSPFAETRLDPIVKQGSEWLYDDAGPLPPEDWYAPTFNARLFTS